MSTPFDLESFYAFTIGDFMLTALLVLGLVLWFAVSTYAAVRIANWLMAHIAGPKWWRHL